MQRRSFLKSMLCTAAAAVAPPVMAAAPEPALRLSGTTITSSAAVPLQDTLTLEDIRRAMEIMRNELGDPPPRYVAYVHPDNLAIFVAAEGPEPIGRGIPLHVSEHCEGVRVLPDLPLEPQWPKPKPRDPFQFPRRRYGP